MVYTQNESQVMKNASVGNEEINNRNKTQQISF